MTKKVPRTKASPKENIEENRSDCSTGRSSADVTPDVSTSASPPPLSIEDLHLALAHLLELAAAYEGRGVSTKPKQGKYGDESSGRAWVCTRETGSDHGDYDDENDTLTAVVNLMLKHRRAQRQRQLEAISEEAMFVLGELFWSLRDEGDECRSELRSRIQEYWHTLGFEPTDAQLEAATKTNADLTAERGPYEAAKRWSRSVA